MEKASKAVLGTPCISLSEPNTAMRCANCCGIPALPAAPSKEKAASVQPRFSLGASSSGTFQRKPVLYALKKAKHFIIFHARRKYLTGHSPKRRRAHRHTSLHPVFSGREANIRMLFTTVYVLSRNTTY